MKKNTAIIVTVVAWDTILNTGKTGLSDITLRGVGDGTEYTPAASAVEVDATNLPGVYSVSLTEAENNYNSNLIGGKSATANISIFGISWINEEIDFGATEKASITAAVPTVVQVQDGLAPAGEYDTEMSRIDVAVSTRTKPADTQAKVTLVDTVTENSDMRGTDYAGTAINLAIVDGVVDAIKLKTDTLGGAGAVTWTYTIMDSGTGLPISDVDVWITSDLAGTNVIASGKTDASGVATFYLDAGTIYVWRQKSKYNFTNPDTEEVTA